MTSPREPHFPESEEEFPESFVDKAERLLAEAIKAHDIELVFGKGEKLSELIKALARAGSIKQAEAKRRLKAAFSKDFTVSEWDLRLQSAYAPVKREPGAPRFIFTEQGNLASNLANAMTMMRALPIRFNSFTCRTFLEKKSPWGTSGDWTDYDDIKAAEWCQLRDLNISSDIAAGASGAIGKEREPYSPVAEYLKGLKWDEKPRCDTWLIDFLGAADTQFVRDVSAKWLISAVNRAINPGCQADYTLVLEGKQGKRKSTALRTLAGSEWFTDDVSDIGMKDSAMQIQGKWIVELGELDAVKRAKEVTTVKAWLVRRVDNFRPPYARRPENFPRQNVFAASTNRDDWGTDETGLRRFWPVLVNEIDIAGIAKWRDQLWAEAFHRYQSGEISYLSETEESRARAEQGLRQETDSWDDLVEEWIAAPTQITPKDSLFSEVFRSRPGRVLLPEILYHCLGIPKKDWNQSQKNRVSKILRMAGWNSRRATRSEADEDGKRPEFWEPMK